MPSYKQRVAAGLCGKCGGERQDKGSLCPTCREKEKLKAAEKRKRNSQAGTCVNCGKPTSSGKKCDQCKTTGKASRNRSVYRKKQAGICVACPNEAKPGCTLCQTCIDYRSEVSSRHYQQRKSMGTCYFCSDPPLPGQTLCEYHREKYVDYRLETKLATFDAYGGRFCSLCGEDDTTILEIDHIAGGGCQHRREVTNGEGGYSFYLWLKRNNYPTGYRVLCPTCNKKAHVCNE